MKSLQVVILVVSSLSLVCKSACGSTEIEQASSTGNLELVKLLIAQGADVNSVDTESTWEKTPLLAASEAGNHKVVALLLSHGADPEITNAAGASALRKAAYRGHVATVKALLEGGADPESDTDYYQRSPWVWTILGASKGKSADYKSVLTLLHKHGAICTNTFIHPVNDSVVKVVDSAKEAGPEIYQTFNQLCKP